MFYIFETQHRTDGVINLVTPITRQSFSSGYAEYLDRKKKMVADNTFPEVDIMITDKNLNVIEKCHIDESFRAGNI